MYDLQFSLFNKVLLDEILKMFVVETQMRAPSLSAWMPKHINGAVQEKSRDILQFTLPVKKITVSLSS